MGSKLNHDECAPVCSFHSISFPSEWGEISQNFSYCQGYVSIQLVSPASGENYWNPNPGTQTGFHSISFPSEWGVDAQDLVFAKFRTVSIQLVSPASGESVLTFNATQSNVDTIK